MVKFCVFSLLLSYASQEPSGNISLWCTPPPHWNIRQIDLPLPPGKSDPFCGGGRDIFWNHTIALKKKTKNKKQNKTKQKKKTKQKEKQ